MSSEQRPDLSASLQLEWRVCLYALMEAATHLRAEVCVGWAKSLTHKEDSDWQREPERREALCRAWDQNPINFLAMLMPCERKQFMGHLYRAYYFDALRKMRTAEGSQPSEQR